MPSPVYLDYNATAPVRPQVAAAMAETLAQVGNASSVHRFGRSAQARLERARAQVAALIGARPSQVIFTSGGTEANNLALNGIARNRVLVSAVEHDSVLRARQSEIVPVDRRGLLDLAALDAMLASRGQPALLSVMLANNETGAIQPVDEVMRITRTHGALVHCDAVPAAGKIPVDWIALGVDLMSLSAHKLGGPPGVGALVVGDQVDLSAIQRGGGQERRRRAGTENLPGIVGFGVAAELASAELPLSGRIGALRDDLERRAVAAMPATRVIASDAPRLPNTSCLMTPGLGSELQVMALDLAGVAVSAGAACSSGKVQPSHVLRAMGLDDLAAGSAIRVSLGWQSMAGDIDRFVEAWSALAAHKRDSAALTAA